MEKVKRICPRCEEEYDDFPSISRRDNKTKICPRCGMVEAFEDYFKVRYIDKIYWEENNES